LILLSAVHQNTLKYGCRLVVLLTVTVQVWMNQAVGEGKNISRLPTSKRIHTHSGNHGADWRPKNLYSAAEMSNSFADHKISVNITSYVRMQISMLNFLERFNISKIRLIILCLYYQIMNLLSHDQQEETIFRFG